MLAHQIKSERFVPPCEVEPMNEDRVDNNCVKPIILLGLLKKVKREYSGLNYIVEFQSNQVGDNNARYFCTLCNRTYEMSEIVLHCSNYMHLTRSVKLFLPKEYGRLLEIVEIDKRIDAIKSIIKIFQKRVNLIFEPELVFVRNLDNGFYEYIQETYSRCSAVEIEKSSELYELSEKVEDNEKNITIYSNVKETCEAHSTISTEDVQPTTLQNRFSQEPAEDIVFIKNEPVEYKETDTTRKHKLPYEEALNDLHSGDKNIAKRPRNETKIEHPEPDDDSMRLLIASMMDDENMNLDETAIDSVIAYLARNRNKISTKKYNKIENRLNEIIQKMNKLK